jgi:secretory carrier-associated membrane protein
VNPATERKKPPKKKKPKAKSAAPADHVFSEDWEEPEPNSRAQTAADASIAVREANLARREQELMQREAALKARERRVDALAKFENNWPCKCYPLAYHSIKDEIPEAQQGLITKLYMEVLLMWVCLFWNWLNVLIAWWEPNVDGSSSHALWATIYVLAGVPLSWRLWYRSMYYAARDDSSKKWIFFFVNFGAHIAFCALMATGIPGLGSVGIWRMFDLFANKHTTLGIMALVSSTLWCVEALAGLLLIKMAHTEWRGQGQHKKTKRALASAAAEAAMEDETTSFV